MGNRIEYRWDYQDFFGQPEFVLMKIKFCYSQDSVVLIVNNIASFKPKGFVKYPEPVIMSTSKLSTKFN